MGQEEEGCDKRTKNVQLKGHLPLKVSRILSLQ